MRKASLPATHRWGVSKTNVFETATAKDYGAQTLGEYCKNVVSLCTDMMIWQEYYDTPGLKGANSDNRH